MEYAFEKGKLSEQLKYEFINIVYKNNINKIKSLSNLNI